MDVRLLTDGYQTYLYLNETKCEPVEIATAEYILNMFGVDYEIVDVTNFPE